MNQGLSDRKHHTIHVSETLMRSIDQQYVLATAELYPQKIGKADFLEAILKHGLADIDKIKALLAKSAQVGR